MQGHAPGFSIHGPDNDSFYYAGAVDPPACQACGLVLHLDWVNSEFQLNRTQYDFSFTYDGVPIASRRFSQFVAVFPGIRSLPLPSTPGHTLVIVDPIVRFDVARRRTTFRSPCSSCGRFREVAGATPVYLQVGTNLPTDFSRTDVEFGSAAETPNRVTAQWPQLLVDPTTAEAIAAGEFNGLRLQPIHE
jgi:hypothetical protein